MPASQKLYIIKVVKAFLKSGIPLQQIEELQEILEYGGYRLTDSRGMHELVPFIHSNEETKVKEELLEKLVSVICDG